jgi:hypothetical protein
MKPKQKIKTKKIPNYGKLIDKASEAYRKAMLKHGKSSKEALFARIIHHEAIAAQEIANLRKAKTPYDKEITSRNISSHKNQARLIRMTIDKELYPKAQLLVSKATRAYRDAVYANGPESKEALFARIKLCEANINKENERLRDTKKPTDKKRILEQISSDKKEINLIRKKVELMK